MPSLFLFPPLRDLQENYHTYKVEKYRTYAFHIHKKHFLYINVRRYFVSFSYLTANRVHIISIMKSHPTYLFGTV